MPLLQADSLLQQSATPFVAPLLQPLCHQLHSAALVAAASCFLDCNQLHSHLMTCLSHHLVCCLPMLSPYFPSLLILLQSYCYLHPYSYHSDFLILTFAIVSSVIATSYNTSMKVQTRAQDLYQIVTNFNANSFKTTSLHLSKQHIPQNAKLDTSKLVVLKHHTCDPSKFKEQEVESWVRKAKSVGSANEIIWARVEQKEGQLGLLVCQKYLPFGNLTELIDPTWNIDCDLLLNLAHSVRHFHDKGIVIANLKPENILLSKSQKQTFITDFRMPFLDTTLQRDGSVQAGSDSAISKWSIYSPQEAKDQYYDEAGDIYSLGLIYFELCTHQRLTDRSKETILLRKQQFKKHQHGSALDKLFGAMVRKDFRRRLSIEEVISKLQRIQQGEPIPNGPSETKLYLPLMRSSPNLNFYLAHFNQGFRSRLQQHQMQIMIDDKGQLLKLTLHAQGCPFLTTYTYAQLPEFLRPLIPTIRQLYQTLRHHQDSLSLTKSACLLFPYHKPPPEAAQLATLKQPKEQSPLATKNSAESQPQLTTAAPRVAPESSSRADK